MWIPNARYTPAQIYQVPRGTPRAGLCRCLRFFRSVLLKKKKKTIRIFNLRFWKLFISYKNINYKNTIAICFAIFCCCFYFNNTSTEYASQIYLQQYRSSCPHGQSITPSQIWLADMHLLLPQCNEDLVEEALSEGPFIILPNVVDGVEDIGDNDELKLHSPHSISSLWSEQSRWPSHRQSDGMHLVPSHWNPLLHTT